MIRFHHHHQTWLQHPKQRRWQRLHIFWPNGRKWRGIGMTLWAHEFSIALQGKP